MKEKYIYYLFVRLLYSLVGLVFLYSCTEQFDEYNTNKSQLTNLTPNQLGQLFSRSQTQGNSWLTTDNYSRMSNEVANHFSGYIATGSIAYEQNDMHLGHQNTGFNRLFASGIPPLLSIIAITEGDEEFVAEYNVALIWKVFLLHRATDLWGPIPYTYAGSGEESIPYESQKDVYYLMFNDLEQAISALTLAYQKDASINAFGSGDMIYNGNVSKWIKLGNTLRLRLAMRISNKDPHKAKLEAEAAVEGETMNITEDDALLDVTAWASGGNGVPRIESWYANVMSASMESVLKGYNDPRMEEFFSPVEDNDNFHLEGYPAELIDNVGGYHGIASGYQSSLEVNYFKSYSNYGPRFKDGNQLITPLNIMHSAETYFLKAEGAWRGWDMKGTAREFYEKGIEVSIKQWREDEISDDSIQNYVQSMNTPIAPNNYLYNDPPMTDIPVKFSDNAEDQYEQILTQKWLALFPISFEAWAEYRRTRLPKIYAKKTSTNANIDVTKGQIITRLPFPNDEKSSQPDEVEKAIKLLGEGVSEDLENIPLWWDVNNN